MTIGRAANLGQPVLSHDAYWPLNTTLYVTDFRGNDPYFTYYLFETLDLSGFDSGSVQPMLNRNYIKSVVLDVPGPEEQRRIGAVLLGIDRAIEASQLASRKAVLAGEALYRHYVGHYAAEHRMLRDLAVWHSGGTPRTSEPAFWGGDTPWISATSLKQFLIHDSDRRVTDLGLASGTRLAPRGATLIVVRGMSLKSELRVGMAARPVAFGQDCKALIAKKQHIGAHTLAFGLAARRSDVLDLVDEAGHGTGRLDSQLLGRLELPVPAESARRDQLEQQLGAVFALIEQRARVERSLLDLRSRLVPALVSGHLVVPQVDASQAGSVEV